MSSSDHDRDQVRIQMSKHRFAAMGWTEADWDGLDDLGTWEGVPLGLHLVVREWLRAARVLRFQATITPADVRETFARYGQRTPKVLNAYAAGASHRFVGAVLGAQPGGDPVTAWECTQREHLAEPDATGWAATGYLFTATDTARADDLRMIAGRFTYWTQPFGPTSYLYVLAGLTLAEAISLRAAGKSPTEEQLRVMVALNGAVLPASDLT